MSKKEQIRTCIACKTKTSKQQLCRFVRVSSGSVELDKTSKAAGRGAYICSKDACFEKMKSKNLLAPRLRCKVTKTDYERLQSEFEVFVKQ